MSHPLVKINENPVQCKKNPYPIANSVQSVSSNSGEERLAENISPDPKHVQPFMLKNLPSLGKNMWANFMNKKEEEIDLNLTPVHDYSRPESKNQIEPSQMRSDHRTRSLTSKINQSSEIFKVKEEYIFVFGGADQGAALNTVEVFDTHREIWRSFPGAQEGQICDNLLCKHTFNFQAVQFSFKNSSKLSGKMYLLGGEDLYGNNLSSVQEFNINQI